MLDWIRNTGLAAIFILASLSLDASAGTTSKSRSTNYDIVSTRVKYQETYSGISITGVNGGTISHVMVEWNVDHDYVSDVDLAIRTNSGWDSGFWAISSTGNNCCDGYDQTSDSYKTLYPPSYQVINDTWYLVARDYYDDSDNGRLDSWKITVYFADPLTATRIINVKSIPSPMIKGQSGTLSAKLEDNSIFHYDLSNKTVRFYVNGSYQGSDSTNNQGVAERSFTPSSTST